MILTKPEIEKAIKNKTITITPFNKNNIGSSSIDLTLDNKFRIFNTNTPTIVDKSTDYKTLTEPVREKEITLQPQETILGLTKEKISLPNNICGWLEGRSRFARLGLMVHVSSGFVQPGVNNHQVLEISNLSPMPLTLKAGTKICQLVLQETRGEAIYKGKFQKQTAP